MSCLIFREFYMISVNMQNIQNQMYGEFANVYFSP